MTAEKCSHGVNRSLHIGVMAQPSSAHAQGVARYARRQPLFRPTIMYDSNPALLSSAALTQLDGLILSAPQSATVQRFAQLMIPAVNTIRTRAVTPIATVATDNVLGGRMAAEFLVKLGFRQLAFIDSIGEDCHLRYEGMRMVAGEHRLPLAISAKVNPWDVRVRYSEQRQLAQWLRDLPKPLGVLAFCDFVGSFTIECANLANLRIPDDVAVVGYDDEEIMCLASQPSLSSIDPNTEEIAYQAARRLHAMLTGHVVAPEPLLIPPRGVIERDSTNMVSQYSGYVRAAIDFIRLNAGGRLKVEDVVRHVGISASSLRQQFLNQVGRTLSEELWRVRVTLACELLRTTDWTLNRIATRCGFASAAHLSRIIKQTTGQPPTQWRTGDSGEFRQSHSPNWGNVTQDVGNQQKADDQTRRPQVGHGVW